MGLIDDLKYKYQNGNLSIRLIFINVGIYLALFFVQKILKYSDLTPWIALEGNIENFITKPWAVFTYMFVHLEFFHLVFNMFMLYIIGDFFYKYFGDKAFSIFYFVGGISGGILFILLNLINPQYGLLMGASAAIYSVLFSMVAYQPELEVRLFFVSKPVKLLYVAIGFIVLGFLLNGDNLGGNISHIGGALFGYFYMKLYEKGNSLFDWTDSLFKNKSPLKAHKSKKTKEKKPPKDDYEYNDWKAKKEEKTNIILEKISRSGYNSLTEEEKDFLFKQGKR